MRQHRSLQAAGMYLSDIEAVSLGKAGANFASPDNLAAFQYNPAGLAGQKGSKIQIGSGLSLAQLSGKLNSQTIPDNLSANFHNNTQNCAHCWPTIIAGLNSDLGIQNLAVGLAVYTPALARLAYSDTTLKQQTDTQNYLLNIHALIAYRVWNKLSFGIVFGTSYFRTLQQFSLSTAPLSNEPAFMKLEVQDNFTFSANFGLRYEPIEKLSLGFSLTPPLDIEAYGKAQIKLPNQSLDAFKIKGDEARIRFKLPLIARLGIKWQALPWLNLELGAQYEHWAVHQSIEIVPKISVQTPFRGFEEIQIPVIEQVKGYRDAFSVRLGGEFKPISYLTARLGVLFESSATTDRRFDLAFADSPKIGAALGASFKVWKLFLDVGYMHLFGLPITVKNSLSLITALNPTARGSESAYTPQVLDGRYQINYDIIQLGIRIQFF